MNLLVVDTVDSRANISSGILLLFRHKIQVKTQIRPLLKVYAISHYSELWGHRVIKLSVSGSPF